MQTQSKILNTGECKRESGEIKRNFGRNSPHKPYISHVELDSLKTKAHLYDLMLPYVDERVIVDLKANWISPLAHRNRDIPQTKYSTKKTKRQQNYMKVVPEMGLTDFMHGFAGIPANLSGVSETVKTVGPSVMSGMEKLAEASANVDGLVTDIKSNISTVYDWLNGVHDSAFLSLGIVTSIHCLFSYSQDKSKKTSLVMGSMVGMMVVGKIAHSCKEEASKLYEALTTAMTSIDDSVTMEEVASPEFGVDSIQKIVQALVACVTVYISTESGVKIPEKLFKNFSSMDRVTNTISSTLTIFISCIESVVNYIRDKLLGRTSLSFLNSNSIKIDNYLERTRDISRLHQAAKFPKEQHNLAILENLVLEGQDILLSSVRDKHSMGVLEIIKKEVNDMQKLVIVFREAQLHTRGIRQEPVSVMLSGGAGIGKSVAMQYLVAAVLGKTLSDEEFGLYNKCPSDFAFNRQAETKYWDGMEVQAVTTFDDFGQALDIPGSPDNEFMNWLRAVNTYEYDMHTAAMLKKGNAKFHSKFVFATTNRVTFRSESIFSTDALDRRIDFRLIVAPKKENTKPGTENATLYDRKLDRTTLREVTVYDDKLEKDVSSTLLDPSVQEFHFVDNKGTPTGETISFEELVTRVVKLYNTKRSWHLVALEDLKKVALSHRPTNFKMLAKPQSGQVRYADFIRNGVKFCDDCEDLALRLHQEADLIPPDADLIDCEPQYFSAAWILFGPYHPYVNAQEIFLAVMISFERSDPIITLSVHDYIMGLEYFYNWNHPIEHNEIILLNQFLQPKDTPNFLVRLGITISDFYSSIMYPRICSIGTFMKENPLVVLGGAALIGTILSSSLSSPAVVADVDPESMGSESKMGKKIPAKTVKSLRNRGEPQISHNNAHVDLCVSLEKRNVCQLFGHNARGSEQRYGYITFIKGRVAIVPLHFIKVFEQRIRDYPEYANNKLFISNVGYSSSHRSVFTVGEFVDGARIGLLEANDLVLVEFPEVVQPHRDILDFFVDEADLVKLDRNISFDLRLPGQVNKSYVGIAQPRDKHLAVSSEETGSYTVRYQYEYKNFTKNGDCGGLFTVVRPEFGKRIIAGIHVAACAAANRSYAASICREDIEDDLRWFSPAVLDSLEPLELDNSIPQITLPEGKFDVLGTTKKKPAAPTSTAIRRSPLHGKWGPAKEAPALLRPKIVGENVIDPLLTAHSKYGHTPVYVDPLKINKVVADVLPSIGITEPSRVKEYTTEELLYGQDGEDFLAAIPSDTSAGYPMNVQGERNIKKEFFSKERGSAEQAVLLREIEEEISELERKYHMGIIPQWVFTDNLKDERRPLSKVASGSTRKFSGCPFYYLLLLRKYFGAFVGHTKETRITNSIAVGVNPYSDEWNVIVDHLSHFVAKPNAPIVGAGDFSAFDGHQLVSIHLGILDLVCRWYTLHGDDRHNSIRRKLYSGILNSLHISDGTLFYILGNMSSGVYGTSCWNSLYNIFSFRLAFMSVYPELKFSDHVRLIVFGDDNVFSTSKKVKDKFNELTLPDLMKELGQVYTREDKMRATLPFRPISEIDFLKRSFIFDKSVNRYIAPLNLDVIIEIPYWTKAGERGTNITIDNVAAALRELSLYPPATFNKYAGRMVESMMAEFSGDEFFYPEDIYKSQRDLKEEVLADESYMF